MILCFWYAKTVNQYYHLPISNANLATLTIANSVPVRFWNKNADNARNHNLSFHLIIKKFWKLCDTLAKMSYVNLRAIIKLMILTIIWSVCIIKMECFVHLAKNLRTNNNTLLRLIWLLVKRNTFCVLAVRKLQLEKVILILTKNQHNAKIIAKD